MESGFPFKLRTADGKLLWVPLPKALLSPSLPGLASGFLNPCHFQEYDNYHLLPAEWAFSDAENVSRQKETKWIRNDQSALEAVVHFGFRISEFPRVALNWAWNFTCEHLGREPQTALFPHPHFRSRPVTLIAGGMTPLIWGLPRWAGK